METWLEAEHKKSGGYYYIFHLIKRIYLSSYYWKKAFAISEIKTQIWIPRYLYLFLKSTIAYMRFLHCVTFIYSDFFHREQGYSFTRKMKSANVKPNPGLINKRSRAPNRIYLGNTYSFDSFNNWKIPLLTKLLGVSLSNMFSGVMHFNSNSKIKSRLYLLFKEDIT